MKQTMRGQQIANTIIPVVEAAFDPLMTSLGYSGYTLSGTAEVFGRFFEQWPEARFVRDPEGAVAWLDRHLQAEGGASPVPPSRFPEAPDPTQGIQGLAEHYFGHDLFNSIVLAAVEQIGGLSDFPAVVRLSVRLTYELSQLYPVQYGRHATTRQQAAALGEWLARRIESVARYTGDLTVADHPDSADEDPDRDVILHARTFRPGLAVVAVPDLGVPALYTTGGSDGTIHEWDSAVCVNWDGTKVTATWDDVVAAADGAESGRVRMSLTAGDGSALITVLNVHGPDGDIGFALA